MSRAHSAHRRTIPLAHGVCSPGARYMVNFDGILVKGLRNPTPLQRIGCAIYGLAALAMGAGFIWAGLFLLTSRELLFVRLLGAVFLFPLGVLFSWAGLRIAANAIRRTRYPFGGILRP